jgi:transposase
MYIELTDEQWAAIEYYLPPENYNGRPRQNDRAVINGVWQRIAEALLEAKASDLAQVALDTSYVKAKKGAA